MNKDTFNASELNITLNAIRGFINPKMRQLAAEMKEISHVVASEDTDLGAKCHHLSETMHACYEKSMEVAALLHNDIQTYIRDTKSNEETMSGNITNIHEVLNDANSIINSINF